MNIEPLKVKFSSFDDEKKFAVCSLDFGDFVIKGFRVRKSKFDDKLWVDPPSFKSFKGYNKLIFFRDKELWEKICQEIIQACEEKSKKIQAKNEY